MPLSSQDLINLVGKPVEGNHPTLKKVSGELQRIDPHTLLGAIADPRFKDSPALKEGLVWVDINTIRPKETVEGDGFVLHRCTDLESAPTQGEDRDSLINEIVEGKRQVEFSYIPPGIEQPQPFINPTSQTMLDTLTAHLRQELTSLNVCPVAAVLLPSFYEYLKEKYPGGIDAVETLGLSIYQRDPLTLPEEPPHEGPFRLFFDLEELQSFLLSTQN